MPAPGHPAAPRRFRPRLLPALATAAGVVLFVHLGQWQHGKALQSEATLALYQQRSVLPAEPIDGRMLDSARADAAHYTVRGRYEPDSQYFLDNRQQAGVPGVHVITALKIDHSETRILVNRGWIGWPRGRGALPQVQVPAGPMQVTGIAQVPSTKRFFLITDRPEPGQRLWNRVDLERFAAQTNHAVQPVVLLQDADDAADGLIRRWPAPQDRSLKHRSYALQWFAMAAALVVFYAVASLRKPAFNGSRAAPNELPPQDAR